MNLLRQLSFFRNVQNVAVVSAIRGRLLLPFSTISIPESHPSSSAVDCPSSQMVDYLINSCGLPSEAATGICLRLGSRGRVHKAKRIIDFLTESGFTDAHIRKAITRNPNLLCARLETTVMPRVRAFLDWGLSGPDVGHIVATNPMVLYVNFEKKIVPIVDELRALVPEDEMAVRAIRRFFVSSMLGHSVEKRISTNLAILRSHGVPDRSIPTILVRFPMLLAMKPSSLEKIAEKAHQLWHNHGAVMFTHALVAVASMRESLWDAKIEVLKEFGWTQEDITLAFQKAPLFLTISAGNLKKKLEFFMEDLSYKPSEIAAMPNALMLSLEKRVIPRVAVIKLLDSKKLLKRKKRLFSILWMTDKAFCQEYVLEHKNEFPDILEAYNSSTKVHADA